MNRHAWSPDGKVVAYAKSGSLAFLEVGSGEEREVSFADVDERVSGYAAATIAWSPDSRAVVCKVVDPDTPRREARAGARAGAPAFGDRELFVIPRTGKPTWFYAGGPVRHVEWVPGAPSATAAEKTPVAVGDWSESADGLRGRLLVDQGPTLGDGKTRETLVYVELQNVAESGERNVYFDPDGLKCELLDAAGKAAPRPAEGGGGSGGRPGKAWVRLPHDSTLRLRASPYGYGSPDAAGLLFPIGTDTWLIKAGDAADYFLAGTFASRPKDGAGINVWAGELKLPKAKVVRPAAPSPVSPAGKRDASNPVFDGGKGFKPGTAVTLRQAQNSNGAGAVIVLCVPAVILAAPPRKPAVAELLEDDAVGLLAKLKSWAGNGMAETREVFSGTQAVKILPMQVYDREVPGWKDRMVQKPKEGEYRYLRFAWKADRGSCSKGTT
jgi:hypothetical protein